MSSKSKPAQKKEEKGQRLLPSTAELQQEGRKYMTQTETETESAPSDTGVESAAVSFNDL